MNTPANKFLVVEVTKCVSYSDSIKTVDSAPDEPGAESQARAFAKLNPGRTYAVYHLKYTVELQATPLNEVRFKG